MERRPQLLNVAPLAVGLVTSVGVAMAAAQPVADNVRAEPHGVSIRVRFETARDALCVVESGRTNQYGQATMQAPAAARRDHRVDLLGLDSSTDYHFRIGCLGEGFSSSYTGDNTARTLTKKVRVTFESLTLSSDSDFFDSAELFFTFDINGGRVHRFPNSDRVSLSGPCGGYGQGCVGDTFVPVETDLPQSFVRTVDVEDPNVHVRVYGNDDDGPWNDDAEQSFTFAVPLTVESSARTRLMRASDENLDFRVRVRFDVFHE